MKDLIRKILKEETRNSVPNWVKEFESLSVEEKVESIKKRKRHYEKLIPIMIEFFKENYGNKLEKIDVEERNVHYGHEVFSLKIPCFIFYFNDANEGTKWEVRDYFINLFGVDLGWYGAPFDYEMYVKTWNRI